MSTENNKLPEDTQLSSLYKQAKQDMPPSHIDDAILAASKRKTPRYSLPYAPFSNNWRIPASLAAVLVLSFGVVTLMEDEVSPVDGIAPLAIEDTEFVQTPEENKQAQLANKLAKAPMKARAKRSPAQVAVTSESADVEQEQLSFQNMEIERKELLARKKKQASQRMKSDVREQPSFAAAMPLRSPSPDIGSISTGTDEQAMLPYWQYQDAGMSIRLVQRLPDQTRGYFVARGFSSEHAELIAQSCVFQTVFKNISDKTQPSAITYHMGNWVVSHNDKTGKMKTREKWATQWQSLNVAPPARLAFEWSLLPTTQDYQPGDYNWGMAIFNLSPADSFTLKLTWQQHGEQRSVTISNMQCAADINADPEIP